MSCSVPSRGAIFYEHIPFTQSPFLCNILNDLEKFKNSVSRDVSFPVFLTYTRQIRASKTKKLYQSIENIFYDFNSTVLDTHSSYAHLFLQIEDIKMTLLKEFSEWCFRFETQVKAMLFLFYSMFSKGISLSFVLLWSTLRIFSKFY